MMRIIFIALFLTFVGAQWYDHPDEVCFGAKDNDFGKFTLTQTGKFHAIKLTHTRGYVTCIRLNSDRGYFKSRFGCTYPHTEHLVGTFVSTDKGAVIFPTSVTAKFHHGGNWAEVRGMDGNSSVLAYSNWKNPMRVVEGDEFFVAYSEDLRDSHEGDNEGRSCVTVSTYVTA